jgi:hypothetical protein
VVISVFAGALALSLAVEHETLALYDHGAHLQVVDAAAKWRCMIRSLLSRKSIMSTFELERAVCVGHQFFGTSITQPSMLDVASASPTST